MRSDTTIQTLDAGVPLAVSRNRKRGADHSASPDVARNLRAALTLIFLATASLAGCAPAQAFRAPKFIAPPPPATTASAPDATAAIDWSPYARVLADNVTDNNNDEARVDYFHVSMSPAYPALMRVYAQLTASGPVSKPAGFPDRAAKLAYYLNAHNLLALLAIAPFFGPGVADPRRVSDLPAPPETGFVFLLDGQRLTLDKVRRERIVPLLAGDPRPLLALTAGRRNDPPLCREPYSAARLDAQLADQLVRVLRGEPWCVIDYAARQVQLPAGVADYPDYYWAGYLAKPHRTREGADFLTVLLDYADARGRAWLNRAIGYKVVAAPPADKFNDQPLFRSYFD